jgi:acyl-CoA synthetase (AMP-forming)/AMP-acid ligase II
VNWNFGDVLDAIEPVLPPDALAVIQGERRLSWREFSRASNNLARALIARGATAGDKVAFYMRNRPEYLIGVAACVKARLVHVNVNYRYVDDELHYILDNSDSVACLFGSEFAASAERLTKRLPKLEHWIQTEGVAPAFADSAAELMQRGSGEPLEIERSPDDLIFVYTGGTTGMPKGVMWPLGQLWRALGSGASIVANRGRAPATLADHVANVKAQGAGPRQTPCCPLMHGTGLFTQLNNMLGGGCSVLLEKESFDAVELFDNVQLHRVNSLVIVGDAFARPMLAALDANPGRWDLSSLKLVLSSGVMWSREVKLGLLRHHQGWSLGDLFGSSEAIGFGSSMTNAKGESGTAVFRVGENCAVFTEAHEPVVPGSGVRGFIARRGAIPLGYYKDPEKTAKTFPTIRGERYSVPGDWCLVEADGTLTLLGRGSACINTAGEKVFPEEVEESLKNHGEVVDALVVGMPDERWGQAVIAVVELRPGAALDDAALRAHVRGQLAGYKVPKRIFATERMFRGANGKADYKAAQAFARAALGIS